MKLILHMNRFFIAIVLLAGSLVYGGVLISSQYTFSRSFVANGSADTASPNYNIQAGTFGQSLSGSAESSNYSNSGGFVNQAPSAVSSPAVNLSDAYVY